MHHLASYNIHGILGISVFTERTVDVVPGSGQLFRYFQCNEVANPDVTLRIGDFKPANAGCVVVDHRYYIRDDYIYCREKEGRARWEVEIQGFEKGPITINFNGSVVGLNHMLLPDYFSQYTILAPTIELLLVRRGFVAIHGLGLGKHTNCVILAGRGGTHKTRTAVESVRKGGFRVLGDDKVIVSRDGTAYAYPVFGGFLQLRASSRDTESITTPLSKAKLLVHLLRDREQYEDYVMKKGTLKSILVGSREVGRKGIGITECDQTRLARRITASNLLEFSMGERTLTIRQSPFHRYMLAYSYVNPSCDISDYPSDLLSLISAIAKRVRTYEVRLPEVFSEDIIRYLDDALNGRVAP